MIRFAHPWALQLIWLVPIALVVAWLEYRWRLKAMSSWAKEALWDASLPDRAPMRLALKRGFWALAIGFIALALAGPQVGTRTMQVTREGTDVVIALDVSKSMLAEDVAPSRMLKAKHEILKLLEQLRGDRVALVPFAGAAFVQVPLTLDYGALGSMLNSLDPGMIPQPGTAIGDAIKQARKAFRSESKAQKILILITDGEDQENGAVTEAKEAAKEGVLIFTVGMASPEGAPIPEKDDAGRVMGYKQASGSGTVISKLNESLLTDVAGSTGGDYYRDNPGGDEFRKIYERILGMSREKFEQKQFTDYEDRFQWPLAMAFLLLLADELVLPYRRRKDAV